MGFGDLGHERQSETRSRQEFVFAARDPIKIFEDPPLVLGVDPDAIVDDPSRRTLRPIVRDVAEYFIALLRRFRTACSMASQSTGTCGRPSSVWTSSSKPCCFKGYSRARAEARAISESEAGARW
jgi:hypothetical protein